MKLSTLSLAVASIVAASQTLSLAAAVSVDGVIGAEWAGVTPTHVSQNALVDPGVQGPGSPGLFTESAPYDVYLRKDTTYLYVGLQSDSTVTAAGPFANLYFDTTPGTGSDVGFEVMNDRAFKPGFAGYYSYGAVDITKGFTPNAANGGTIEFAVPLTFFTSDPLSIGFTTAASAVQLRTSQSFGYAGASGTLDYSGARFGSVLVPEPTTLAALAGASVLGLRRRRA